MLFPSDNFIEKKAALLTQLQQGKISDADAARRLLKMDPTDYLGLTGLIRVLRDAGELAEAEEYARKTVDLHPCSWQGYMALAEIYAEAGGKEGLEFGFGELGLRKLLLDEEEMESEDDVAFPVGGVKGMEDLSKAERIGALAAALRERRDLEPVETTSLLRPFRLIHRLQEDGELDEAEVDAMLALGQPFVPFLIGVLRGYAQEMLFAEESRPVESAIALLGQFGDPDAIPHLLGFTIRRNFDLAAAARWTLDRIVEKDPASAAEAIRNIVPQLDALERAEVSALSLRHRELDGDRKIAEQLLENVGAFSPEDRRQMLPLLMAAGIARHGKAGAELARQALRRDTGAIDRNLRRVCTEVVEECERQGPGTPPDEPRRWTVYEICSGEAEWPEEEDEKTDDEWEDETDPFADESPLPPEPIRRQPEPGRNDPCWCGSGKKYKKCHLGAGPVGAPVPAVTKDFNPLRRRLGEFLRSAVPDKASLAAVLEFLGDGDGPEAKEDTVEVGDWMIHDWVALPFGRTVMEEYLRRNGTQLNPEARELVASWAASYQALYEVQEVERGRGVHVKALLEGSRFLVHDVSAASKLVKWDTFFARVILGERGSEITGVITMVPRDDVEQLIGWMEAERNSAQSWAEFLKSQWPKIRRRVFELAQERLDSLHLTNTDGEELLFSTAVYRLVDREAVLGGLRSQSGIEEAEDDACFVWLSSDGKCTVHGRIEVLERELRLETNSRERLRRGAEMLAQLAPKALKHVRDEFPTQAEMKRRATEDSPRAVPEEFQIPDPEKRAMLEELLRSHYASWPDTALPALGGRTPREAVKTRNGRQKVEELLKDLENSSERANLSGKPFFDAGILRRELGLDGE